MCKCAQAHIAALDAWWWYKSAVVQAVHETCVTGYVAVGNTLHHVVVGTPAGRLAARGKEGSLIPATGRVCFLLNTVR